VAQGCQSSRGRTARGFTQENSSPIRTALVRTQRMIVVCAIDSPRSAISMPSIVNVAVASLTRRRLQRGAFHSLAKLSLRDLVEMQRYAPELLGFAVALPEVD
jgi:hypothetical protein